MSEKYKLLLIGSNKTLIYDFFVQMEGTFEMLSCSRRVDDIRGHLKYYHPNALVMCLHDESRDDLSRMSRVKGMLKDAGAVMIVVGENKLCDDFERMMPRAADYVIRRSKGTTCRTIGDLITNFLETRGLYEKKPEDEVNAAAAESAPAASIDELLAAAAAAVSELKEMPEKPGAKVAKAAKAAKVTKAAPAVPVRHHVLVVDDDSSMLRMIKEILSDEYDVATAISGKVALKFLENRSTDIILLDYEMPQQSGSEVYEKLLENPATKDIPVVFLTGVSDRDRIAEVLAMRPRGYLLKPIDSERLKKTITEIVG
jgi:CheY-like chemotaxis protein